MAKAVSGRGVGDLAYRLLLVPGGKLLVFLLFLVFGPLRVRGRARVPRFGGVLILPNHISDADPPAVGFAVPRRPLFMAKSELFDIPILGRVIRWFRAFPVKRGAPDRAALRQTIELLHSGECVVMFPEGECSETGELLRILPGATLVIRQSGVPIVCCGIRGTNRILPYGKLLPRPSFGFVRIEFGVARTFGHDAKEAEVSAWIESELLSLTGRGPRAT